MKIKTASNFKSLKISIIKIINHFKVKKKKKTISYYTKEYVPGLRLRIFYFNNTTEKSAR